MTKSLHEVNPLRFEVASGRPAFVVTNGASLPSVIEAARVTGRLDDLRVANLDPRATTHPLEVMPWTRMAPDIDGARELPPYRRLAYRDVPLLEEADMPWHRAIVVLILTHRRGVLDWASYYGMGMAERVAETGGDSLARFSDEGHSRLFGRRERGVGEEAGGSAIFDLPGTGRSMRVDGSLEAVRRCMAGDGVAWTEALSVFRRTLKVHRVPGLSAILSEDRLVVAAIRPQVSADGSPTVPALTIYETDAKGALACARFQEARTSDAALHDEAMAVWTGGIGAAANWHWRAEDGAKHRASLMPSHAALGSVFASSLSEPDDPNLEKLRFFIRSKVDLPLLRAASFADFPDAVLARVTADPAARQRRREFCMTWPGFGDMLLDDEALGVIDAGRPTLPYLSDRLGLARAVTRRLVERAPLPLLVRPAMQVCLLEPRKCDVERYPPSDLFGALGHDRIPARGDKEEWRGFMACARALAFVFRRSGVASRRVPAHEAVALMLGGPKGAGWAGRGAAVKELGRTGGMGAIGDIGDMVRAFASWLDEVGHGIEDRSLAFRIMARHGAIPRLAEASLRWHDTPALAVGSHRLPRSARWLVPFEPVDLGDGWSVRAVSDVQGLVDEGGHGPDSDGIEGLRHCVGTYAARAFTGECLILSLRRVEEGRIVRDSTVELTQDEEGDWSLGGVAYRVHQHRGQRNARPGPEAVARLGKLKARLDARQVILDFRALERRDLRSDGSGRDRTGVLLGAWRPVLPESLRDVTLEGLLGFARRLSDEFEPRDLALEREDFRNAVAR